MEAKGGRGTRSDLRHDNHTVSLLTDHLVFSPKYRGKVLLGEVAEVAEEIIRNLSLEKKALPKKQGKRYGEELDIEVIDMAVNADHVHLFIKYPPKYSVSWIAKRIKRKSSKLLRDRFQHLREWCPDHLWAPSCYHGSVGHGWEVVEKYISGQKGYTYEKTDTVSVVVINEEKEKALKTGYITLHTKLFTVTGSVS
ncbi:MAG: IS200/IS605 family transposase [Methanophagales archaeon]|nr:IS200/IS605 family transposase [Methanophagales archaeon]